LKGSFVKSRRVIVAVASLNPLLAQHMNFVLQQTSPHAATISDKRASPRATFDYAESDAALIESDAKRARRAEFAFSPAEGGNPAQSPFLYDQIAP